MNCYRARQLISPYLDHQLTGRQMLDLQQHFSECRSCESEARSLQQVKRMLRALQSHRPGDHFPEALMARVTDSQAVTFPWQGVSLPLARPQRGRRLTTALAFSCLVVLITAAPFAPASRDVAISSELSAEPHLSSGMIVLPENPVSSTVYAVPSVDLRLTGYQSPPQNVQIRNDQFFLTRVLQSSRNSTPQSANDVASGYMTNSADFAGYRNR